MHLLSWAELDTGASVLSERELDTVSTFSSSALSFSPKNEGLFPVTVTVSDSSWLRDAGSTEYATKSEDTTLNTHYLQNTA